MLTKWGLGSLLAAILLAGVYILVHAPKPADTPVGSLGFAQSPHGQTVAFYSTGMGRRVILLASLGRSGSDFNQLAVSLEAAGYRSIIIEPPGVGESDRHMLVQPTLYDLALDIEEVVLADGGAADEEIIVIGHAFGNRLARAYAHVFPERVSHIVLIAAGGGQDLQKMPEVLEALLGSFKWWLPETIRMEYIRHAFFADGSIIPDSWKRGWYSATAKVQSAAVRNTPYAEWKGAGGRAPILVLQGSADTVAPAELTSAPLLEQYPDRLTIEVIAPAGHAILPERPEQVARSILSFLQSSVDVDHS